MLNLLYLFSCGLVGIIIHNLTKIKELTDAGKYTTLKAFYTKEWSSMALSVGIVVSVLITYENVQNIHVAGVMLGNYFAILMVVFGYSGQSLFKKIMSFVNRKADKALKSNDQ